MIKLEDVCFGYDHTSLLEHLSISFPEGKIISIIGPNGSGKTTLFMLICRILQIQSGKILLNDKNVKEIPLKEYAKKIAVVHQKNSIDQDLDVETIVGYGRLPYLGYFDKLSENDYEIIDWALDVTDLNSYRKRNYSELSGGQQQRVWIALALAQKTPILLLDEPTTYLDIKYQLEILELVKTINEKYHMTIIMIHHDINQAVHFSHHIVALKNGKKIFDGKSIDLMNHDLLKTIYDDDFTIFHQDNHHIALNY
ncbi:ABC transporter ATP-binding protein [Erysipelotrichaceae bacterium HCN-30851]